MSTANNNDPSAKEVYRCNNLFLTHKWEKPVSNVQLTDDLMRLRCMRCGIKYETLYIFRKERTLKRYHDAK